MNCTSYYPSYYQLRNLNTCESGFSSHQFVVDGNSVEEWGNGISLLPVNLDQHLGYNKELLSQIIQKHEATFQYQLQELHRLYKRQRELMDEIKVRQMLKQHIQFPTSQSNNCLSEAQSEVSQTSHTTSWILGHRLNSKLSVVSTDNLQGPSVFVAETFQEQTARPGSLLARKGYHEVKAPSFISKGHEMRILNLQHVADVYGDADEKERSDEVTVSKASKMDLELDAFKTGDTATLDVRCRNTNLLIDLNEPIQLESVASSSTLPLEPYPCYMEFSHHDQQVSGEVETESLVSNRWGFVNCGTESVDRNSSVGFDLNSTPLSCLSENVITQETLLHTNQEPGVEVPKDHLSFLVAKPNSSSGCSSKNEMSQASGVDKVVSLNTRSFHHQAMTKEKWVVINPDNKIDEKLMEFETRIDLNVGVTADEICPSQLIKNFGTKFAGETDFKAPVNPENKEVFPPRGKSDDILRTPYLQSEREGFESDIEVDGIAAETLLLISSAIGQDFNLNNCLYWFAEIASSTVNADLGNKFMKLQNSTTDKDGGKLLSDGIDEFKDMALKLSQKKPLNPSPVVRKQKESFNFSCRPVKCSTANNNDHMAKAFQRTCSPKRNAGRNSSERTKKQTKSCPSGVKKSLSSILKEPVTRSKVGILQSWGKIKKRRGIPRRCASKYHIIS